MAQPQAPGTSTGRLARVVLGLFAILALAIIAGHARVREAEKRAGLAMFVATGMPFLAIGVVGRLPQVGVLTDDILRDLAPVLEFGLGWIGFRVGTEFDVRLTDRLPGGAARLLAAESTSALVACGAASVAMLVMVTAPALDLRACVRDGLILGACAAVSAPTGARALEAAGIIDRSSSRLIRRIAVLDDVFPIVALAVVTSLFRPVDATHWQVPTLGWLFLQIGMGAMLGALTVAIVRAARNANEEVALTLGSIAFASGMAGFLALSPLVIGCVAGLVVANVTTGRGAGSLAVRLRELERPIFMVFFAMAGALWDVRDWRGWAIVPLFVLARLAGKLVGARTGYAAATRHTVQMRARAAGGEPPSLVAVSDLPDGRTVGIALIPTSAVSIAVIVSGRLTYGDAVAGYLETVVIAGAVAAELLFQLIARLVLRTRAPLEAPEPQPEEAQP